MRRLVPALAQAVPGPVLRVGHPRQMAPPRLQRKASLLLHLLPAVVPMTGEAPPVNQPQAEPRLTSMAPRPGLPLPAPPWHRLPPVHPRSALSPLVAASAGLPGLAASASARWGG